MNVYVVMEWREHEGGALLGAKRDQLSAMALAGDDYEEDINSPSDPLAWTLCDTETPDTEIPDAKRQWTAVVPKRTALSATRTYDIYEIWVG